MILKNAINLAKNIALIGGPCTYTDMTYSPILYPLKDVNGNEITSLSMKTQQTNYDYYVNTVPFMGGIQFASVTLNYNGDADSTRIIYGTGTTPVTEDDYKLENIISSGLTNQGYGTEAVSVKLADGNSLVKTKRVSQGVKNNTASDITIKEVGIYQPVVPSHTVTSSSGVRQVLIYREVLSEPVTIPAGSFKTFDFEFNITHKEA